MSNAANLGVGGLRPFRFASLRGTMPIEKCQGTHDIYVAEVLHIPAEGRLVVITVCRGCDNVNFHDKQVHEPHQVAMLLKEKEKQI